MVSQSRKQKGIVERVMHAFKDGELEQRNGEPVHDPKQAIAIALSEAGASNERCPGQNRKALARTTRRERGPDAPTKADLYAEARTRDLPGRSAMSKSELQRALGR